jgi:hypothetical protein
MELDEDWAGHRQDSGAEPSDGSLNHLQFNFSGLVDRRSRSFVRIVCA